MPQFNLFKSSEEPVAKTPACPNCGRAMRLYDISRTGPPGCKRSYSVARSAPNSVPRSSNMKRSTQRTERRANGT